jgi:hypothetical protein
MWGVRRSCHAGHCSTPVPACERSAEFHCRQRFGAIVGWPHCRSYSARTSALQGSDRTLSFWAKEGHDRCSRPRLIGSRTPNSGTMHTRLRRAARCQPQPQPRPVRATGEDLHADPATAQMSTRCGRRTGQPSVAGPGLAGLIIGHCPLSFTLDNARVQ